MNRRLTLALCAPAVLAALVTAPAQAQRKQLVFSILSAESQTSAEKEWTPFLADMQKAIGLPVKAYYGSNYTGLIEAMRFKQTDMGWFTNLSGLEAVVNLGNACNGWDAEFARDDRAVRKNAAGLLVAARKASRGVKPAFTSHSISSWRLKPA